jgi:hypothetical protein
MLIALLLFISLYSCRSTGETEKEIKQFLNSKVDLPDKLVQQLHQTRSNYHLVVYLNAENCVPCSLSKFTTLNHYKDDFEKFNTDMVLIVDESEGKNKEQIEDFFSDMRIRNLLFFDEDNYLLDKNPIISTNHLCRAFIVDTSMKVIWIGYPHANAKSIERYREMMKILHKNPGI